MFHARRWHQKFSAPMVVFGDMHIFVNDFVLFNQLTLGSTIGKVKRIFTKVSRDILLIYHNLYNYMLSALTIIYIFIISGSLWYCTFGSDYTVEL